MLKKLSGFFLSVLMLCAWTSIAQNNNASSPYSRFGLGDLHPYSYGRFAAMGGASIGSRHNLQINISNPASYSSIDSLSFVFEFGADGRFSDYKSTSNKYTTNDVNFRYFALSFPITNWLAASMGVNPYADKGYEIYLQEDNSEFGTVIHQYQGSGTISKAFMGFGVDLTSSLSVGFNVYYLFGKLTQQGTVNFVDLANAYDFAENESSRLRDFAYNLGIQYDIPLKNNKFLTLGATFENKPTFTAFHNLNKRNYLSIGNATLVDTLSYISDDKSTIQLPTSYGFGASLSKSDKYEVNADYYFAKWSEAKFYGNTLGELTDQSRFSIGAEFIPEATSIRSFLKRIKYRAGMHYEKSYLKLNNHQINEFGISFGVGLPVNRSRSSINLAIEAGRRGTTANNLVRENYTKISLYLNLFDRWFYQRKFD